MRAIHPVPLIATALAFAACATNPATGKKQLSLVSESQEIEMGKQAAAEVEQSIGLVEKPELQAYVKKIGLDIAKSTERPNLPWSFAVVDDPTPNAFALPGGYIFVTRGLTTLMQNEAELATVLGHEIGHVTARHSVSQMSKAQIAQLGLGLGSIFSPQVAKYGDLLSGGLGLLFLRFSRDAERQADDLGFRYALAKNYSVTEMANVFKSLARLSPEGGAIPSFLQTHPEPGERVKTVTQKVAALPASGRGARVAKDEYLHAVDGIVYGEDPRQGYFKGAQFLHPNLKFQFAMPEGWKGENLKEAVMGASADGKAALQLTIPGALAPRDAAAAFAKQQGVTVGDAHDQTINGLPAVVGRFDAQTESGALSGVAAWIAYEGHTYALLTYTTQDALPARQGSFQHVVESFAPLKDPEALSVKPRVLNVVSVSESQTLADFNQRQPSAVPIEELAVINELAGPTATLASGSLAKRIVGNAAPAVRK